MAFPTAVNSQITDSVVTTQPQGMAASPQALASIYGSLATSVAALNASAVDAQEQLSLTRAALISAGIPLDESDAATSTDASESKAFPTSVNNQITDSVASESKAFPTSVNDQITDSATGANVPAPAESPAVLMGRLFVATSQALANAAHNATEAQYEAMMASQAATSMGIATIYGIDTTMTGDATYGK